MELPTQIHPERVNKPAVEPRQIEYTDESGTVADIPAADVHHLSILNCYGSFGTPDQVIVGVNQVLQHPARSTASPPQMGMKLPVIRPAEPSPVCEPAYSDDSGIITEHRDDITVSSLGSSTNVSPQARFISPSITHTFAQLHQPGHHAQAMTDQYSQHASTSAICRIEQEPVQGPSQTIEIVPQPDNSYRDKEETPNQSTSEMTEFVIKTEPGADPEMETVAESPPAPATTILGTLSVVGSEERVAQAGGSILPTVGEVLAGISPNVSLGNVVIKEEPMDEEDAPASVGKGKSRSRKGKSLIKGDRGFKSVTRKVRCKGVKKMTTVPGRKCSRVAQAVYKEERRRKLTVFVEDFLKIRLNAISKADTRKRQPSKQNKKLKVAMKKTPPKSIMATKTKTKQVKVVKAKSTPLVGTEKGKRKNASPKKEKQSPTNSKVTPIVIQPIREEPRNKRRKLTDPADKRLDKITMNLPGNTRDFIEEYHSVEETVKSSKPQLDERTKKIVDAVLYNPKNERFKKSLSNFKKGIFLCQICNKRCKNRKAYVRHQKDHAGVIDVYIPYITKGIGPMSKIKSRKGTMLSTMDDISSGESEDEENYECKVCGKVLQSKRTYRHHKTIHQRIDPSDLPRCSLCGTFFTKMTSLHHHLRTAHFVCWQCGERRQNAKDLNHHRKTAHSALCEICGQSCLSPKALTQHAAYHFLVAGPKEFKSKYQIRKERSGEGSGEGGKGSSIDKPSSDENSSTEDESSKTDDMKTEVDPNDPRPYLCQCGRKLKTWDSFQAHSMIHRGLKPYSCPVCKKGFLSSSSRKTHVRHVHSDDRPYRCEYCAERFKSSSSRDVHIRLHHTKEKPHKCDECDMEFSLTSSLKSHKQAKHSISPDYKCTVCNREFKLPGTLAIHMRQHTGEKPYVCKQCGKAFRQGSHLRTHVRTHSDERLYPCQICNKSFTQSSHLNTHMKIHQDSKDHKCQYCGKGFNLANTLKTHLRIHTGEKPFKCSICDRTFNQSSARNSHEKCHSDEKPLECGICGARFKLKGTLKTHMLVHSKKLPYECSQCDKAFTTSSSLKLHVNTKHEKNLQFACSHCDKKFVAKHLLERHEVTHIDATCKCDECGKTMKNKFTLKSHTKKYHSK